MEALRKRQFPTKDMVYIGDNEMRNIIHALQAEIVAIHYNETEESQLNIEPFRVQSLAALQPFMESRLDNDPT